MATKTFVGFSTLAPQERRRSWALHDIELIKRDLMNHFYTRVGERIMRPTFGCNVWDYIMEPNIDTVQTQIYNEVERVCRSDDRLDVDNIQLYQSDHTIVITMQLIYRPFETTELFRLSFDKRQGDQ